MFKKHGVNYVECYIKWGGSGGRDGGRGMSTPCFLKLFQGTVKSYD